MRVKIYKILHLIILRLQILHKLIIFIFNWGIDALQVTIHC